MSNSIKVRAEHEYDVVFTTANPDSLAPIISGSEKIAIIVPADLRTLADPVKSILESDEVRKLGNLPNVVIIEVPEGEGQKELHVVERCWEILGEHRFKRSDSIIGLGGGATTDLAGFVAATWLRGIRWAAIPTSLAGMVDAAVGGKTGINTPIGKNLVGSFHSPQVVVVNREYLLTLPEAELRAGLAEVIKCGFISDQRILEIVESEDDVLDPKSESLQELIRRAIQVKAEVVSEDLKESFAREILNYGHTLAHAVERHQKYSWRHGDAVAVGLAYIANLALECGIAGEGLRDRHIAILKRVGLPTNYPKTAWSELLAAMQSDKKARSTGLRFVAVTDEYSVIRLEGVSDETLHRAYERIAQ